jgi:hypothetical protein
MTDTLAEKLRQITADDNDEADILFEAADRIEELQAALLWCGGSADFGPEGQAREGWKKICVPLLRGEDQ